MCTIYNNIKSLCDERGIKPGRMCVELGMSKSILACLKNGTKKNIQTDTAQKIADYFGVTVDRVLGAEKETAAPKDDGLSPMESQLMEYVRALTDDQKKMLLAGAKESRMIRFCSSLRSRNACKISLSMSFIYVPSVQVISPIISHLKRKPYEITYLST